MASNLTETHCAYILGLAMGGIANGGPAVHPKEGNWTARGAEGYVEVGGVFYKITVEPHATT